MELEFSIESWTAWSSSKGASYSHQTSIYATQDTQKGHSVDLSLIPAMKRRRMNQQCKMAISSALDCLKQSNMTEPHCVFASQHGELARSTKIINSMIAPGEVSPTDFSMSVHNTALGLLSIQTANRAAGTSIAAGDDTFGFGLLEACSILHSEPSKPVLYVYFDEPLPEELITFDIQGADSRCVALLLSANHKADLRLKLQLSEPNQSPNVHLNTLGVDKFVEFCGSPQQQLTLNTKSHLWRWKRLG